MKKLSKLLGLAVLAFCGAALGQTEIVLDNTAPAFAVTGT